jgi:hypothetical protein
MGTGGNETGEILAGRTDRIGMDDGSNVKAMRLRRLGNRTAGAGVQKSRSA